MFLILLTLFLHVSPILRFSIFYDLGHLFLYRCLNFVSVIGRVRGRLCTRCNLQLREPTFLPILLHNMSHFDGRLILGAVSKFGHTNVTVLPQSVDIYISITINRCRYLDSARFLNASLSKSVDTAVSETDSSSLKFTRRHFGDKHADLFIKKQLFCYDYLDGPENCHPNLHSSIDWMKVNCRTRDTNMPRYCGVVWE